ncbi:hypothetical protein J7U46_20905 [Pelomonas sp. V22]|uniref:tetratricopeptide repeat protein n=1 Tax=Pelomonas sp. V22 TaxID=2822139 RepID=UPI0024A925F5|nr:tetratricopeptide repeat protein [Pelomonas sp. V22]MDI4635536.1 hypothetical protein [Pelomonas sp. V22]
MQSENFLEKFLRLFDEERYAEALPLIEEIVAMDPTIETSWTNLGETLKALGRPVEAANAFVHASLLNPERRGLYSACHALAESNEREALHGLCAEELERDPSMLGLFMEAEVLDPFFDLPEFQELVRRYGYH